MACGVQLILPARPSWGGRRRGAGRRAAPGSRPGVPHRSRPLHARVHPVHATLRTAPGVRCLRAPRVFPAVRDAFAAASRPDFRLVHFSAQDNHVHLLVEADDAHALSCGLRGLAIRVARAVNRVLGRRGALWADRYHARALTTPRAVHHALVYVLMNVRKHHGGGRGLDPCSSAPWFNGWRRDVEVRCTSGRAPVARPRTWLAAVGWRRHGLLGIEERPSSGRPLGSLRAKRK